MKANDRASVYKRRAGAMKKTGYISYEQFLASDLWREIKNASASEYKNSDICCFCRSTERVVLHHKKYTKTNFTKAVMKNLIPVCSKCHYRIHCLEKEYNIDTMRATLVYNILYWPDVSMFTWEQAPKQREDDRVLSMRIIEQSGLPETLHHSLHACMMGWINLSPIEFIAKYRGRKEKKRDTIMLDLLTQHEDKVKLYLLRTLKATTE